jgi:hypothetical protein
MDTAGRVLIVAGVAGAIAGVVVLVAGRLGLGRLPGDISIEHGNVRFFLPVVTSIVLSLVLTVVLNIAVRLWR